MRVVDLPNQQFTVGSPEDLANQLGSDGIRKILLIMYKAYENLIRLGKVTTTMNETIITEELSIEVQEVMRADEYRYFPLYPRPEKSHDRKVKGRGKTPTIDFCFRHRWQRDSYFGAECKLLKENNNTLYKDYMDGGVCRYLTGRYGEFCSCGSMIGYISTSTT